MDGAASFSTVEDRALVALLTSVSGTWSNIDQRELTATEESVLKRAAAKGLIELRMTHLAWPEGGRRRVRFTAIFTGNWARPFWEYVVGLFPEVQGADGKTTSKMHAVVTDEPRSARLTAEGEQAVVDIRDGLAQPLLVYLNSSVATPGTVRPEQHIYIDNDGIDPCGVPVREQLTLPVVVPKTPELTPLGKAVHQMLLRLTGHWTTYEWEALTATEQEAIVAIESAGLVERRTQMRGINKVNSRQVVVKFVASGNWSDTAKAYLLKQFPGAVDATGTITQSLRFEQNHPSFELRLTSSGEQAKVDAEQLKYESVAAALNCDGDTLFRPYETTEVPGLEPSTDAEWAERLTQLAKALRSIADDFKLAPSSADIRKRADRLLTVEPGADSSQCLMSSAHSLWKQEGRDPAIGDWLNRAQVLVGYICVSRGNPTGLYQKEPKSPNEVRNDIHEVCDRIESWAKDRLPKTAPPDAQSSPPANATHGSDRSGSALMQKVLAIYTSTASDARLTSIAKVIKDDQLTVNEKLLKMDEIIKIPATTSAQQLANQLDVSKTAVMKTDWWRLNRSGDRDAAIDRRRVVHQGRKKETQIQRRDDQRANE